MINLTGTVLLLIQGKKPRGKFIRCNSFEHAEFIIHKFCRPMKLEKWQKETMFNELCEQSTYEIGDYSFNLYDNKILSGIESFTAET